MDVALHCNVCNQVKLIDDSRTFFLGTCLHVVCEDCKRDRKCPCCAVPSTFVNIDEKSKHGDQVRGILENRFDVFHLSLEKALKEYEKYGSWQEEEQEKFTFIYEKLWTRVAEKEEKAQLAQARIQALIDKKLELESLIEEKISQRKARERTSGKRHKMIPNNDDDDDEVSPYFAPQPNFNQGPSIYEIKYGVTKSKPVHTEPSIYEIKYGVTKSKPVNTQFFQGSEKNVSSQVFYEQREAGTGNAFNVNSNKRVRSEDDDDGHSAKRTAYARSDNDESISSERYCQPSPNAYGNSFLDKTIRDEDSFCNDESITSERYSQPSPNAYGNSLLDKTIRDEDVEDTPRTQTVESFNRLHPDSPFLSTQQERLTSPTVEHVHTGRMRSPSNDNRISSPVTPTQNNARTAHVSPTNYVSPNNHANRNSGVSPNGQGSPVGSDILNCRLPTVDEAYALFPHLIRRPSPKTDQGRPKQKPDVRAQLPDESLPHVSLLNIQNSSPCDSRSLPKVHQNTKSNNTQALSSRSGSATNPHQLHRNPQRETQQNHSHQQIQQKHGQQQQQIQQRSGQQQQQIQQRSGQQQQQQTQQRSGQQQQQQRSGEQIQQRSGQQQIQQRSGQQQQIQQRSGQQQIQQRSGQQQQQRSGEQQIQQRSGQQQQQRSGQQQQQIQQRSGQQQTQQRSGQQQHQQIQQRSGQQQQQIQQRRGQQQIQQRSDQQQQEQQKRQTEKQLDRMHQLEQDKAHKQEVRQIHKEIDKQHLRQQAGLPCFPKQVRNSGYPTSMTPPDYRTPAPFIPAPPGVMPDIKSMPFLASAWTPVPPEDPRFDYRYVKFR